MYFFIWPNLFFRYFINEPVREICYYYIDNPGGGGPCYIS